MKRLKKGDHIRVVSPSSSIESIGGFEANVAAKKKLEALGFRLSFSEHYLENDIFDSAPIASRVADLEAAFANETVDAILTTIGGFNCNELLPYLDFDAALAVENMGKVHPGMPVFELSAKTREGMEPWLAWLRTRVKEKLEEKSWV